MKKAGIMLIAALVAAPLSSGVSEAAPVSFTVEELAAEAAGSTEVAHPEGEYDAGAAIEGGEGSPVEYSWTGDGESYSSALVFLSTDHASATDSFAFEVLGYTGSEWIDGHFSRVLPVEPSEAGDADDYATLWSFSQGVIGIGVNSWGTVRLSESDANGYVDECPEFDGIAVPEPSTWMLLGSSLACLGFIRRRGRA